jgi:hypothetical protein
LVYTRRGIFYKQYKEIRLTELVTSCVGTASKKHVIEENTGGRAEARGGRGRRHKQLLEDLQEMIGYRKLKEEMVENSLWNRIWTCRQGDWGMNGSYMNLLKPSGYFTYHQGLTLKKSCISLALC